MLAMGAILCTSKRPDYRNWIVFSVVLGIALPVAIARAEFLMHRRAAELRQMEERMINPNGPIPGWETWKDQHKGTKIAMPVFDLWLAIPFFVLFFCCLDEAVQYTGTYWFILHRPFVYGAPLLFLAGCAAIWFAPIVARK